MMLNKLYQSRNLLWPSQVSTRLDRVPTLQIICINTIACNIATLGLPSNPDFFLFSLLSPDLTTQLTYALWNTTTTARLTPEFMDEVFLRADVWTIMLNDFE